MGDKGDLCVPVLETVPSCDRLSRLLECFTNEFSRGAKFVARCSGRVNIIGEHVDYCGYPVFPMAIEQTILLAVAPSNDNLLHIKNVDNSFKPFKCNVHTFSIDVPSSGGPSWYQYVLCGVKGILEDLNINHDERRGMLIMLSGNIPPASGLSSSSAIVSASVLATAFIHNITLNKQILATLSAECEKFIGTQGGGMDQAIAYLAQEGCAQLIDWNPLRATAIQLPPSAVFVIANSLSEANKAATSDFNQRVVECRLACRLLAKQMKLNWRDISRFSDLQKALGYSLEEMEALVNRNLTQLSYNRSDMLQMLEISEDDFSENMLTTNTRNIQMFKLKQRSLHVFQEALRVEKFIEIAKTMPADAIKRMKTLMRQSHESLKILYECSHENLDRIVDISESIGVGTRLTGAGWGGCVVALCDGFEESKCFINLLQKQFYAKQTTSKPADTGIHVFATSPQRGAEIYLLSKASQVDPK
ncbi:N-acetylgalactosamine kinase isoform X1 [Anopheles bellator]|uniref:N-acetylgalactosamine kinase isoform X1 n=2 Tax=Anopheles bellator TaxID=139047 RepID=UPI002648700E|nr:N-acetylgalactosamine kinase isoform X1 [Anopheles bellator]